jgi:hypothetical protein
MKVVAGEPFFNAFCGHWRADLPRKLLIKARQRSRRDEETLLYAELHID